MVYGTFVSRNMKQFVCLLLPVFICTFAFASTQSCDSLHKKVEVLEMKLKQLLKQTEKHAVELATKEERIKHLEAIIKDPNDKNVHSTDVHLMNGIEKGKSNDGNSTLFSQLLPTPRRVDVNLNAFISKPVEKKSISVQNRANPDAVAFYAYMASDEKSPSQHHTLIFDVLKTNVGNAYNKYNGMFSAPSSGIYQFSVTMHVYCHSFVFAQIMKNNEVIGSLLTDAEDVCDNDSATTNVIIEMNQGDVVFVRSSSLSTSRGDIRSDYNMRTSFSGFKLY